MGFKYIEGSLEITDQLNVKGSLEVIGDLSVEGDYIYARNEIAVGDNDEVMITSEGISVNGNSVVTQEELQTLRSDLMNGDIPIGSVEEAEVATKAYKDGLDNTITDTYQAKTDNALTTTNKTVVDAINEVNGKTVDKISSIELDTTFSSFNYNANVGITYGVERTFLDGDDAPLGAYNDDQRIPIIAGDNVTFTPDETKQVMKIGADMSAANSYTDTEIGYITSGEIVIPLYETKTDAAAKLKSAKDYTDSEINQVASGEIVISLYETKTDAETKLTTINTELEKIKNGTIDVGNALSADYASQAERDQRDNIIHETYVTKASFVLDETTGTLTITIT